MSGHAIQIDDIWVKYPGRSGHVLKGISLSVERGEVLGLLGPSGSGKSTLLKAIAGIIPIEKGKIFIEGRDVTDLPPNKRKLGVVFQSFALFPHMKVWENVAYGLKVRRASKEKILGKVKELLELVGLSGMEDRYPSQLSGGQQQRVALARALAIDPRVILFDEPMSNVDPIFRSKLREEIRYLLKKREIAAVYVTHDREDAFEVSDRIAVLRSGVLEQVGRPEMLMKFPKNIFVAEFLGIDNVLEFEAKNPLSFGDKYSLLKLDSGDIIIPSSSVKNGKGVLALPADRLRIASYPPPNPPWLRGKIDDVIFRGIGYRLTVSTPAGRIAVLSKNADVRIGEDVYVIYDKEDAVIIGGD